MTQHFNLSTLMDSLRSMLAVRGLGAESSNLTVQLWHDREGHRRIEASATTFRNGKCLYVQAADPNLAVVKLLDELDGCTTPIANVEVEVTT